MRSVAPGDQISTEHCSVAQRCLNRIVVLIETLDAGAEAVLDLILGRRIQHIDQVAAQDLQLRHQTVAVEGRDRHIGSSAAIGFDPRDAPLIERALAHLIDEAHTLDHIATRTAQIHGLSAWPNAVGEFDDRHPGATPGQPEGQCRSRDSGSADQDGRLRHGRQGSR